MKTNLRYLVSLLVFFVLGNAAAHWQDAVAHAQDAQSTAKPAYVILSAEFLEPEKLGPYQEAAQPLAQQAGAQVLARGASGTSRLLKNTRIGLFSWPSCVSRPPRQRCARGHAVPTRGPATPASQAHS